ncbi:MAG: indolepyruvate oxidoreductase subunit beta [Acetobacteraceae bacterium]|nr:indolepyruvate oxidoreductase subunit beta [Acetobacteraceae bacterium]
MGAEGTAVTEAAVGPGTQGPSACPRIDDVLVVGVGGQGVLLVSDLLAEAWFSSGFEVKKSEVHGMAQRGGSVESHVRRGEEVHSPLIPRGRAQALVALEPLEALRYLPWLAPGGLAVTTDLRLVPATVLSGQAAYPPLEEVLCALRTVAGRVLVVESERVRGALGSLRVLNVVALGALAAHLGDVAPGAWEQALRARLPRAVEPNLRALELGRAMAGEAPARGADRADGRSRTPRLTPPPPPDT